MVGFIPHGHCYLWKPELVWLHVIADGTIALAYFSIPITLLYFVSKRRDVPFTWIFSFFSVFILLCGSGHLLDIWTLWHPNYWIAGLVKAITAIVSAITALELIPLVPAALALPRPAELEMANRELQETIHQLQKTQLQLIQSEKMSSLGQLVAGIAHEINNPVNFIHGNLTHVGEYAHQLLRTVQLYQRSYPQPAADIAAAVEEAELDFIQEDLPMILASMQAGTERICQTVLSLRNFSRLDEAEMKLVNIHEGIESTLLLLQNRLRFKPNQPDITVVKEFAEISLVQCYAGQLNQVFMNLLINAIAVLEEDPKFNGIDITPTIGIRTRQLEPDWVQVEVSDNGSGMTEQVKQKIFNPFFTTQPVGKGIGLGLSISYQIIVEKHGGELACYSTAGQGTLFQIKIPTRQLDDRLLLPANHLNAGNPGKTPATSLGQFSPSAPGILDSTEERQNSSGLMEEMTSSSVQMAQQKALLAVVTKIQESIDLETLFQSTAAEVRQLLKADRVAMLRFDSESAYHSGEFVAEDVLPPYNTALTAEVEDHCFAQNHVISYQQGRTWVVDDIYGLTLPDCHMAILERFQVRANLVVPLLKGDALWGLLCVHQCSGPRHWHDKDIEFVTHVALHLGVALQQTEFVTRLQTQSDYLAQAVTKAVGREKAVTAIINKIRRSLDINTIFKTASEEARRLLNADRVAIFRFNPDWSGEFVVEAVAEGWKSLVQEQVKYPEIGANVSECSVKLLANTGVIDTYLQETAGGSFGQGAVFRVCADIYQAGFSECYIQTLELYQARSYAIIAIYSGKNLWGLLAAFQNSGARQWEDTEVTFLVQLGDQLSVAIQQTDLLERTQQRSHELQTTLEAQLQKRAEELAKEAERERALAQVIDKIRRTLDLDTIFQTATTEVRQLLNADRAAILCFELDTGWHSGVFVSEDVVPIFNSAIAAKIQDHCFAQNHAIEYQQGRIWVANDIYTLDLPDCHIAILSRFQVRANLVVPLLKGDTLWGLLCIHQCSEPRDWQKKEIEFVRKIAVQLGVALQQAELLTQAQQQSAELQRAKEIADFANRAKTQFLAHMSHELRTPLNVILGFAQVLARDISLTDKQQQHLGTIARSGEHLLTLLNDVLEMAKIEAGQITLHQYSFDLYRLLQSLEEMLHLKAELKGIHLSFSYAPDVPQYIYTDESRLRQILINLLGNAIKFTAKGMVRLQVGMKESTPNTLEFEVQDTGSGIAPDELDTLFRAFMQTETGRKSQEGTGLGLPISQQLVSLMGGDITVSSVVGQGSIFRFQIPIGLTKADDILKISTQLHRRVIGLQPNQPTYRILVVDDKPESRLILVNLMAPLGFEVREAENGSEAVSLWETWEPHLIWMDMRMPVMDGYTATRQIRARPKGQETVIIALTATVFDQQRSAVLEAGCNDFVSKPFQETTLFEKMAEYMGVQYIYDNRYGDRSQRKDQPGADLLTVDRLTVMPSDWIARLYQAATQADDKQIFHLIGQIPEAQVSLSNALINLVNEFQLETIINVIDLII